MTAFEELGVLSEISLAVKEMDWDLPTDIQYEGIPAILGGGDVLMAAETGCGKTGAFCLPILQVVFESLKNFEADPQNQRPHNAPLCIILEPTKELAQQTYDQIEKFKKYLKSPEIKNVLVTGGIPINEQIRLLQNGADIVTCTVGRIRDLIQHGQILLDQIRFYVLDEADSLIANGDNNRAFREIHQKLPKYLSNTKERLQMIVCSATLHNLEIKKLADQYMRFPQWVDLKGQDSVPDTVHQVVCMVDPYDDMSWARVRSKPGEAIKTDQIHAHDQIRAGSANPETLSEAVKILKGIYVLKAIQEHKMQQCIIFCRTKLDCDNLEKFLTLKGYACLCLHGDRNPVERAKNLKRFREGEINFLICTDVAARGLDVRGIPYVINMTLPPTEEKTNYVHRIGRIGRAERMGLAISLVSTVPEKVWYHQCKSRGSNCTNTELTTKGGCAKWYNEKSYLGEVEEHLGITINQVSNDFAVPVDEFDGKVIYGTKATDKAGINIGHAVQLQGVIQKLNDMERAVQISYLKSVTKNFC